MGARLTRGKLFTVDHRDAPPFGGRIIRPGPYLVTIEIVRGEFCREGGPTHSVGSVVTLRRQSCVFTPLEETKGGT